MLQLDRHVPSPGVPEFNRRFGWLIAVVATAFLLLVGRLWQLQVVRGERYFAQSQSNFKSEQYIPSVRGKILDRKGTVLVDNRPSFNLYITPRYFTKDAEVNLTRLLGLTSSDLDELHDKIGKARDRGHGVLVYEDIDRDRLALVEQAASDLPGVAVRDVPHRNYLFGKLAAHVLGYENQISDTELEAGRDEGYEEGDYVGRYGIEKQQENYLRGKRGVERFVVDAHGQRMVDADSALLLEGPRIVPPVPGHNVVLTIDADLQRAAEHALRDNPAGAVAVIEVATGRILALVSKPTFDPNKMTGHLSRAEEALLNEDPYKPFIDRTLHQHYYPGSTYKFVTAIAAIDSHAVTADDHFFCNGELEVGNRIFHCPDEHGSIALVAAIAESCDIYFWHLAELVGMDAISTVAEDFGFGAPTGLGLNGDVAGHIPWKAWYEQRGGYRIGYALNTAIGQGDTEVTVLQLALAYAALANGGDLWVPQIVDHVESASGEVVANFPPTLRRHVKASRQALDLVSKGLWGTVNDKKGTAFMARVPDGPTVAGKTGTAQVRKLTKQSEDGYDPFRDHAWFAGYAPAEAPKIAVVVLVEHGGHGGKVAAPIAMEIVRAYFAIGAGPSTIKPNPDDPDGDTTDSNDKPVAGSAAQEEPSPDVEETP